MKKKIGITGSIGMGKTTVSLILREMGYPVWIADECINILYRKNKKGYDKYKKYYPTLINDFGVNKKKVILELKRNKSFSSFIKKEIYPLLEIERNKFLFKEKKKFIFFELPLLFENNLQNNFDYIICVKAPFKIQRERVLQRENMDEKTFNFFLKKQYSIFDIEKNSDFLILTNASLENVKKQIFRLCRKLI